jgi:hypothetical protein
MLNGTGGGECAPPHYSVCSHTLALGHTRELQPFTRHCYSLRLWPPLSSDLCQTLVSLRPKCSDTSSACPHRLRPAILAPGLNCMFSTSRARPRRHAPRRSARDGSSLAPSSIMPSPASRVCRPTSSYHGKHGAVRVVRRAPNRALRLRVLL